MTPMAVKNLFITRITPLVNLIMLTPYGVIST
jgi:hypothetical protein